MYIFVRGNKQGQAGAKETSQLMDMGQLDKALTCAEESVRLNLTEPACKNLLLQLNKKTMGR